MALVPKEPTDLALAPVAAQVDRNLARLRGLSAADSLSGLDFRHS